jgi:phenylalanyl-tRNA synthetase beta chain
VRLARVVGSVVDRGLRALVAPALRAGPGSDARIPQRAQPATEQAVTRERLRLLLVDRGYQEAITYGFADARLQRLLFPDVRALALTNPISAELGEMRLSLWPGLIEACRFNLRRQQNRIRLFEVGTRFGFEATRLIESQAIAGIVTGRVMPEQWGAENRDADFYDVKSDVESLFALTGRSSAISYVAAKHDSLHPGRSARILDGRTPVGWIGQLQPEIARKLELRDSPWLFEIAIEPSFFSEVPVFKEISRFPAIRRDLAVVVDESVTLDALRESVNLAAKGLLRELHVFDVYRGKGVEPGRKSVALGLILQETSRTLTDHDADRTMGVVAERLRRELDASIRDQ